MHRWSDVTAGGKVLQVGADNYVFRFHWARILRGDGTSTRLPVRTKS
jgi:hypothetical protein